VLTTFVMTRDDALPRQALRAFDRSRLVGGSGNGLTQSRAPSQIRQVIPPFSLWWVAMVHDHAMWRDEPALIRELLPGVRSVLDAFRSFCNAQGWSSRRPDGTLAIGRAAKAPPITAAICGPPECLPVVIGE
jgi:hypothetical protein